MQVEYWQIEFIKPARYKANRTFFLTMRDKKNEAIAGHAAHFEANKEKYGDNQALERRCLIALRKKITEDKAHTDERDCLHMHIMCDGTLADALYRTDRMPKGRWLSWQHKTTHGRATQDGKARTGGWQFKDTNGYEGMVIVCQSEQEDHLWLFNGGDYHTHSEIYIGHKGPTPTTPTISFTSLCGKLRENCTNAANRMSDAFPTTTLYDAEQHIGKNGNSSDSSDNPCSLEIERRGIVLFVDEVLGGEYRFDDRDGVDYNDHLSHLESGLATNVCKDPDTYRLTHKGVVFHFPEEAHSKTDLLLYSCCDSHSHC